MEKGFGTHAKTSSVNQTMGRLHVFVATGVRKPSKRNVNLICDMYVSTKHVWAFYERTRVTAAKKILCLKRKQWKHGRDTSREKSWKVAWCVKLLILELLNLSKLCIVGLFPLHHINHNDLCTVYSVSNSWINFRKSIRNHLRI